MYFLLALIITGILGYFLPIWMYNSSWQEIIGVLSGKYNNDVIGSFNIVKKFGIQNDYKQFFEEKLTTIIILTFAIFICMLIICSIIKKSINKNNNKKDECKNKELLH